MKLLGIDTSGKIASVALCDEETVLAETSVVTRLTHSQVILPLTKKLLEDAGISLREVDGLAVANGPGSYTGLRIGIAAVKAMSFALKKPCIGISTLESLAWNLAGSPGTVCAVMAARQDLVYTATFRWGKNRMERCSDDRILPMEALIDELAALKEEVTLTGDCAGRCRTEFNSSKISLALPARRLQQASSLCMAAFGQELLSPEHLDVRYLQPTKAEKDRKAASEP